jgi:primosomal protein N' (replication factor Y)
MRQQTLFETDPPAWDAEAEASVLVATVVFPGGPLGEFHYRVPEPLANCPTAARRVEPGKRLRVPLGASDRSVVAYCVAAEHQSVGPRRLKSIERVLDAQAHLSPAMLRLTRWIAERYLCAWGQVLDAVVPAGVRGQAGTREAIVLAAREGVLARLSFLGLPEKQAAALKVLATTHDPMTPAQLARRAGCTIGPINALRKKGLVDERKERRVVELEDEPGEPAAEPPTLNEPQRAAVEQVIAALREPRHETLLLFGVTGSGKTEVYLRAIAEAVSYGRQAIVLVPEISLTPQTVERFRARYRRVAVLHSHQSDAVRHWHWQRIARGDVDVVVGARSAVFAPTPHLGLIVMDEEHEASFKQDATPRYHAREVARQRAASEGIPLVLGSATPSLETWHRAQQGAYRLATLPFRVENRPLPHARVVDLRLPEPRGRPGAIGRALAQEMEAALRDGGQVLLLLNRRGYSTHIQCPACGHVVRCPDCDLALTFHRRHADVGSGTRQSSEVPISGDFGFAHLRCHHCDRMDSPPAACPECRFQGIRFAGHGTQKLEEEVRQRFPDAAVLRMDSDSTRHAGSHAEILGKFRRGEAQILLGTQMIAKGLDFPNITLVGVVNADSALHLPDFRAGERTFQLLTQVAGRSGRGERVGRVVVQTFSPESGVIEAASRHDYLAFARAELSQREALGYPPYASLARIIVRAAASDQAAAFADAIAERFRGESGTGSAAGASRVLGPAPAPIARLRGMYRYHLHVHAPDDAALGALVQAAVGPLKTPPGVQYAVDIDPQDML